MSETTQTAMYYNGNWYGRSGNTDALDARITQTANNIAPRQISDTASKLISVGEYFTDKLGRLCVCDVQIASGGNIVVGSNCHVVSEGIGNELNSKMGGVYTTQLSASQSITVQRSAFYAPMLIIGSSGDNSCKLVVWNPDGFIKVAGNSDGVFNTTIGASNAICTIANSTSLTIGITLICNSIVTIS